MGVATPSTAAKTTTSAVDTAEPTEPAAVAPGGAGGSLRGGGTAQEHRSLYCPSITYIYRMSKCPGRIYKSITQC
jgi:hypothetical protein